MLNDNAVTPTPPIVLDGIDEEVSYVSWEVERALRIVIARAELDRYLGSPVLMGEMGAEQKDEVDQLIENDTKRKVRELKKLELDAFMVQKKKEIADATSAITAAQNQNLPESRSTQR